MEINRSGDSFYSNERPLLSKSEKEEEDEAMLLRK